MNNEIRRFGYNMIHLQRSLPGVVMRRSLRSYLINATMRMLVKPRFKSPPMSAEELRAFMSAHTEPRARFIDGVTTRDDEVAGLHARWVVPDDC